MGIKPKMSLKQTLDQTIENIMNNYTKLIADTYNLDSEKLLALWNDSQAPCPKVETSSQPQEEKSEELDHIFLVKCKKPELKALCKKRGVRCTGTKAQLIGYLQGKEPTSTKKNTKKSTKKNTKKSTKKSTKASNLINNITKKVPVIAIRKNQYGNHEHPETHLVFDDKLKKVVGVQHDDGTVSQLTKTDIDICNKFKFSYVIPTNLDNSKLDDEKIEELDEEELDEEELDEEELDEEELDEEELDEEEFEEEELDEEEFEEEFDDELYEEEVYE